LRITSFLTLTILTLVAVVCPLVFPVFADPAPLNTPVNWFVYSEEVLLGEAVAWFIGATLLWNLLKKRKNEISMSETYGIMLLVMIVSFLVGLVFWIFFGWI
jgi:hypothetical protein